MLTNKLAIVAMLNHYSCEAVMQVTMHSSICVPYTLFHKTLAEKGYREIPENMETYAKYIYVIEASGQDTLFLTPGPAHL